MAVAGPVADPADLAAVVVAAGVAGLVVVAAFAAAAEGVDLGWESAVTEEL